ncbi:hypothetical protein ES705_07973 [subsurface metagenome]|jgi:hypothetical protein
MVMRKYFIIIAVISGLALAVVPERIKTRV